MRRQPIRRGRDEGADMSTRENLSASIRERILSTRLPDRPTAYVYTGPGDGARCACCDEHIAAADIQYDLDFPAAREGEISSFAMHLACFHLWREGIEDLTRKHPGRPGPGRTLR
jgi:hypothetical protein